MSSKTLFRLVYIISLIIVVTMLRIGTVPARAQCENPHPSSCSTCHATEDPVNEKGEWHIIHASKDICVNCHGGNGSVMNKDQAHKDLMAHPLDDIYTDCHSCHPDYETRAAQFAPTLGVTPGSCATPTSVPPSNISGGPPSNNIVNASTGARDTTQVQQPFVIISTMLATLALFFSGLYWLGRHSPGARS